MGGRGTYASGNNVPETYRCVGYVGGIKVLEAPGGSQKLPEESKTSHAYVRYNNGVFAQYREYENQQVSIEIGYHYERNVDPHAPRVLHIHVYTPPGNFQNRKPRRLTASEYEKYKFLFKGVKNG